MSVHDEIMTALCRVEMGEGCDDSRFGWRHHADALMPIVKRVAREAALQMAGMCVAEFAPTIEMPSTMLIERADAIVRRVVG